MKKIIYRPRQVRLFFSLLFLAAVPLTLKWFSPAQSAVRKYILGGGAVLFLALFAVPRIFFPAFRLIMIVTGYFGELVFRIIIVMVFYLILTPIAVGLRIMGKRFMETKVDPSLETYYENGQVNANYEKQF